MMNIKGVRRKKALSSAPVISIEDEYFEHESPQSETKRRKTQFVLDDRDDSVVEVGPTVFCLIYYACVNLIYLSFNI